MKLTDNPAETVPRPTKLKQAEAAIVDTLTGIGTRVLGSSDLRNALHQNRMSWGLKPTTSLPEFIAFIEKSGRFKTHVLTSERYGVDVTRYSLGEVSVHELSLSIRPRSYISHGTAAELHQLLKPSTTIYANSEQSSKPSPSGVMTQSSIDAAYARKQKGSALRYKYKSAEIVALNGKQTGQLGVEFMKGGLGETLAVTNIERTLIDIAVRPAYAGGAKRLLKAYQNARNRISTDVLVAMLKDINHRYPFHQAIGFLMSIAGFPQRDCDKLAALGIKYDFYVDYGIETPAYSKEWHIYYPRNLLTA